MKTSGKIAGLLCLATSLATMPAHTTPVTYSASSGGLAGKAVFDLSGTTLSITLSSLNTVNSDNSDVLTALLFHLGNGTLTPTIESDSTILNGSTLVGNIPSGSYSVGGNWAYQKPLGAVVASDPSANAGISTSGLSGLFSSGGNNGPSGVFGTPGANLDGPAFGLINATGNLPSSQPFIYNSLVFKLTVSGSFDLSQISDVAFAYGTTPESVVVVTTDSPPPTPDGGSTLALLGCAFAGVGAVGRRFRKA